MDPRDLVVVVHEEASRHASAPGSSRVLPPRIDAGSPDVHSRRSDGGCTRGQSQKFRHLLPNIVRLTAVSEVSSDLTFSKKLLHKSNRR